MGTLRANYVAMSFLDVQDLATLAVQTDIPSLLGGLLCEAADYLGALEAGFGACLIALAIRRRAKH